MIQIRSEGIWPRGEEAPDPGNLAGDFDQKEAKKKVEDLNGLKGQKKKMTLGNTESSSTKAHFAGTLPVYAMREGLTLGQKGSVFSALSLLQDVNKGLTSRWTETGL